MKYVNKRTGFILESESAIGGEDWEKVEEKKPVKKTAKKTTKKSTKKAGK